SLEHGRRRVRAGRERMEHRRGGQSRGQPAANGRRKAGGSGTEAGSIEAEARRAYALYARTENTKVNRGHRGRTAALPSVSFVTLCVLVRLLNTKRALQT